MGRHRTKSNNVGRHHTIIALSALVPGGLIAAATSAHANGAHLGPYPSRDHISVDAAASPPPDTIPLERVYPDLNATPPPADTAPAPVPSVAGTHPLIKARITAPPAGSAVPAPPPPAVAPPPPPMPAEPQLPTSLAAGRLGVPAINLAAYKNAAHLLAEQEPNCAIPWTLIAGIGRVESTHANDGKADPDGTLDPPIYGPVLDGSLWGNNVIHDTDGGALDGIARYDRAVGPMQFLPETWHRYGADGNGDGKVDPQNLFDAALTTGRYLCSGGLDMRDLSQQTRAILRYNNSMAYVTNVMAWSTGYHTGIAPTLEELPRI
ncbi:lytic transglycosylase domain-containing protein [Aldersonia kunmingensis]|uniref:lytic transglycosylase domain-containing protein n=1 Tax=Aldersonia kunmingensis TaxID=408066 RepID=UPI0008317BBC|nr:lytic murein transglycosylase [Aldersonia kunmingensis]